MELETLLRNSGNEVAVFAMQHPLNHPTQWQRYFPTEVAFSPRHPIMFLKAMSRGIYSFEVSKKFKKLLNDFKPDVVHLNNIHTQISPIIAEIASRRGIQVVWTLHDYKLVCPRYDLTRNGSPCELCLAGKKESCIKYSCIKRSRFASVIAYIEARVWNRNRIEAAVDTFICPSKFIREKMLEGGFSEQKLHYLRNFINSEKVEGCRPKKLEHYCYVGRLSEEKGIATLLEAASKEDYPLIVVGTGPLEQELRNKYSKQHWIKFLGHQDWPVVKEIISTARFMVVSSEWYENCPLSILEALALGTPVIGSDIGGIPELIAGKDGCELFTPGNVESLVIAIRNAIKRNSQPAAEIAKSEGYLQEILDIYKGGKFTMQSSHSNGNGHNR